MITRGTNIDCSPLAIMKWIAGKWTCVAAAANYCSVSTMQSYREYGRTMAKAVMDKILSIGLR